MAKSAEPSRRKMAVILVIWLMSFQSGLLPSRKSDLLGERFAAAKSAYKAGDFAGARAILEPMLPALEETSTDQILTGSAYLFLGAALEMLGEKELGVVNYCRAKTLLGEGIGSAGLDLEKLRFYAEPCPPPLKPSEAEEIPVVAVASVHAASFAKARALYDAKGFLAAKVILEKLIVDLASMEGMEPFKGETYLLSGAVYEKLKCRRLAVKYFRLAQRILGKGKTIAGLELKDFKYYTSTDPINDLKSIDTKAFYYGMVTTAGLFSDYSTDLFQRPLFDHELGGFPKGIISDPNNADLRNGLGYVLSILGKHTEAIASFDKAIELDPKNALAWYNRGVSLAQLGRHEEALANYNKAIKLKADDYNSWNNRGNSLSQLEKFAEALTSFQKAIELKPNFLLAWRNRGIWLERMGRNEEALANFNKMIELKPTHLDELYYKGDVMLRIGEYKEALAIYDELLHHRPRNIVAWRFRGVVLEKLGRKEEAKESFYWADLFSK